MRLSEGLAIADPRYGKGVNPFPAPGKSQFQRNYIFLLGPDPALKNYDLPYIRASYMKHARTEFGTRNQEHVRTCNEICAACNAICNAICSIAYNP